MPAVALVLLFLGVNAAPEIRAQTPHTPAGLPACTTSLMPRHDLRRQTGETVRYWLAINGLAVGTMDFKIERSGRFGAEPVTEYRSEFKLDSLVATFIPVSGRAAALVPTAGPFPRRAMTQYQTPKAAYEEDVQFAPLGTRLEALRKRNDVTSKDRRAFTTSAVDFVTGFYWLRTLAKDMNGCVIVYGNQRAYTVWIRPDGEEKVLTPAGMRPTDRYQVRYASDKSRTAIAATVWLAKDETRLPYRAAILGKDRLDATIHIFAPGKNGSPADGS